MIAYYRGIINWATFNYLFVILFPNKEKINNVIDNKSEKAA